MRKFIIMNYEEMQYKTTIAYVFYEPSEVKKKLL